MFSQDAAEGVSFATTGDASATRQQPLLLGATIRRAHGAIVSRIAQEPGLYLVTGPRGAGKSFLLRRLSLDLGEAGHLVLPGRASFDLEQFLANLSAGIEIAKPDGDIGHWLGRFRDRLAERSVAPVLMFDDADLLDDAVLGAFPPLFGVDLDAAAALRIVLAGRPDLVRRIHQRRHELLCGHVRIQDRVEPLNEADVASLLADEGHSLPEASDSIAAIVHHARGLPADVLFLLSRARQFADEAGRRLPALEDVERAARMLRPVWTQAAPTSLHEPPSTAPFLVALAESWLAYARALPWHEWREALEGHALALLRQARVLIAAGSAALMPAESWAAYARMLPWREWQKALSDHARALLRHVRAKKSAVPIVHARRAMRRIFAGLERRALALTGGWHFHRPAAPREHAVVATHALRWGRFSGPALYGGATAAAVLALFVTAQSDFRARTPFATVPAPSAPAELADAAPPSPAHTPNAPVASVASAPEVPAVELPVPQRAVPPSDFSTRIVMAEPEPLAPPMDAPVIAAEPPSPAPDETKLAELEPASALAAVPAAPPAPSEKPIRPPPLPVTRVARATPQQTKAALGASASRRETDVTASAPGVVTASLVTSGEPQCQPYRSSVDYAGDAVHVSGLACRDSAGEWWVMNQTR